MNNDIEQPKNPRNGKALAGIILLAVGAVLLFRQFDFFFIPDWLFSWPMLLICWGLFVGAKSNFHKPSAFILILLGSMFLINDNVHNSSGIVWPLGIICFGLWMILRRHGRFDKDFVKHNSAKWEWKGYQDTAADAGTTGFSPNDTPPMNDPATGQTNYRHTGDEYLDAVSVFGSVKKVILSKDFRGGDIVNIFGGAELDFTQADINGRVIIDITQIFGGTKLIVPPHWQVVPDIAAVFAGIEDKRLKSTAAPGSEKVLVIKGVSIFAGVDIKSY